MQPGSRIGYLVKAFPVVSETFILNEVRAMENHDVPLAILSLKPAPRTVVHEALRTVTSPVEIAPWRHPLGWPRLARAHLHLLLDRPGSYLRELRRQAGPPLADLARRPRRRALTLLRKRLRRFAWAGWVSHRATKLRVEHLHAHYAGEPLRVAHLVKRLTGVPYSFTAHAKDLYMAPEARLQRRLASARFAIGCHQHGVDTLRGLLTPEQRSKVGFVRHGIDTELFGLYGARRVQAGPIRLLAVGRLTPKKGFDDLISACALLAARGLEFQCDLVGDGRERARLEQAIRARELGRRVRIHGFVPQQDLPSWYSRATALVMPSKVLADGNRDGVPNVLLEAMACATPIVASELPGIGEWLIDGETGLMTRPSDPNRLAEAIQRLVSEPELAAELGRRAAARVEALDFRRTNVELVERFRRALGHRTVAAIRRATTESWERGGLARKAAKRLGIEPQRDPRLERSIAAAVEPGIRANDWRPDLSRLASRRLWDEAIKANRLPSLLPKLLGTNKGARVLDLGSGRGGLAVALAANGIDVTALDLRFRNCAVARWRGRRYGLEAQVATGSGERLPFADSSFDGVACLEVLEHVQDPVALLAEIRRVLTPRGRCVVTVVNRWAHLDPHYHLWGLNFLPRRLANRYIDLRRRTKVSFRDCQTLDEMHYYSYRRFRGLAASLGFRVDPPVVRTGFWARLRQRLSLGLSLGFNTITLVLEPDVPVAIAAGSRHAAVPETAPTAPRRAAL